MGNSFGINRSSLYYESVGPDPEDLALMQRVRAVFDPRGLCNPGKVFPTPRLCGDKPGIYVAHASEVSGLAGRG